MNEQSPFHPRPIEHWTEKKGPRAKHAEAPRCSRQGFKGCETTKVKKRDGEGTRLTDEWIVMERSERGNGANVNKEVKRLTPLNTRL